MLKNLKLLSHCKELLLLPISFIPQPAADPHVGHELGSYLVIQCLIHIHHIRPLYEIKETYVVDPVNDLIPVCPNSHMVLHANGGTTVEELKKRIASNS